MRGGWTYGVVGHAGWLGSGFRVRVRVGHAGWLNMPVNFFLVRTTNCDTQCIQFDVRINKK